MKVISPEHIALMQSAVHVRDKLKRLAPQIQDRNQQREVYGVRLLFGSSTTATRQSSQPHLDGFRKDPGIFQR
jgi:hypothetical protein